MAKYRFYIGKGEHDVTMGFSLDANSEKEALGKARDCIKEMKRDTGTSIGNVTLDNGITMEDVFIDIDKNTRINKRNISGKEEE